MASVPLEPGSILAAPQPVETEAASGPLTASRSSRNTSPVPEKEESSDCRNAQFLFSFVRSRPRRKTRSFALTRRFVGWVWGRGGFVATSSAQDVVNRRAREASLDGRGKHSRSKSVWSAGSQTAKGIPPSLKVIVTTTVHENRQRESTSEMIYLYPPGG